MRKRLLITSFLSIFPIAFKAAFKAMEPYRQGSIELAQLKMSLVYLKAIDVVRLLFLSLLGIGICLMLFGGGLILLHLTLLLYAPWPQSVKMYVNVIFALVYLGVSIGIFAYVFAHAKWLEMFQAQQIVDKFINPKEESRSNGQHTAAAREGV